MSWLRNLFGTEINPEEYERVRCDLCNGTGLAMGPDGRPSLGYKVPRHCGRCGGKGWLMVKRRPTVLSETVQAGSGVTPETATADAPATPRPSLPPDPIDQPEEVSAPDSPAAPEGFEPQ